MNELPPSVRWSERAYRWMIRAYPADYGRRFGEPMVQLFTDMATDAQRKKGLWGLVGLWFRVLVDLAWSAFWEHYGAENRRPEMKTALYAVASILLAIVVQWFFTMVIGMAILFLIVAQLAAEPSTQSNPQCVYLLEWLMFFLPAFLASMVLVHTKPVYRPWLTAPLGAMAIFFFAFLGDSKAPWWAGIIVIPLGGALSLAGCFLGSRIPRRQRKGAVPSGLTG